MESFKIENLIYSGSFGNIYNLKNDDRVIKRINITQNIGILGILELYIIRHVSNRYIISSDEIIFDKTNKFDYAMKRAISDVNNNKYKISYGKFFFQITLGLLELHSKNILHGDIKPNNILIFKEGNEIYPKLCDFGLSILITPSCSYNEIKKFFYSVSFYPPEIFNRLGVYLKSDIWALGCTFYKIYYGQSLFPKYTCKNFQGLSYNNWSRFLLGLPNEFDISNKWYNSENILINKLLTKMLQMDVNDRYSIYDVLNDEFFDKYRLDINLGSISSDFFDINNYESLLKEARNYTEDNKILFLAIYIYINKNGSMYGLKICINIAHKIVYNVSFEKNIDYMTMNKEIELLIGCDFNII